MRMSERSETTCCKDSYVSAYPSRRRFLFRIGNFLNLLLLSAFPFPFVGSLLSPLRRETFLKWISLGPTSAFPANQTRLAVYKNPFRQPTDGATSDIPCWVRHLTGDSFQVFSTNCSHLGCPVRWFPESELFMCPCHGGTFHADGTRASGPPPRGLYVYPFKVEKGELWINAGEMPLMMLPKP
jgi:menaquinol-cytochrome c reductase iron-sulfur subunit